MIFLLRYLLTILDQFRPSYIRAIVKGCGNMEIKYCKTHRGHYNEVKYVTLPKIVQDTIVGK